MDKLLFGPAGIPSSTKNRNTQEGILEVKNLGLDAMELEFVHSVNISAQKAPEIKKIAKESNILLTCHAPYYINLNTDDAQKRAASRSRILKSAQILDLCGGFSVAFHPGFYMKKDKDESYKLVRDQIKKILDEINDLGIKTRISPETTGKGTQFGDLNELLRISQELGIGPCIDYAHLEARSNGAVNGKEEFMNVLAQVEKYLGKEGLKNMHIQFAGVEYTEKGEKRHLELQKSTLKYKEMVESWKEYDIKGAIISESPNQEKDALLLKRIYNEL